MPDSVMFVSEPLWDPSGCERYGRPNQSEPARESREPVEFPRLRVVAKDELRSRAIDEDGVRPFWYAPESADDV
jgi:hypothetical protein